MRNQATIVTLALTSIIAGCGGSDSTAPDSDSTTPSNADASVSADRSTIVDLWTPAAIGDTGTLKVRLDDGADVNALDSDARMTPLAFAANFGQVTAVKMLLEAGAAPDARNGNGSTAALGAAFFGRPECLKLLLDAGADPDLADENGTTTFTALSGSWDLTKGIADLFSMPLERKPLEIGREGCWEHLGPMADIWTAAATGEITALKARMAEGVDVDAQDPINAATPLAIAANFGTLEVVEILIDAGANPNALDANGGTPVLGAAFFGRPACLRALLDAGADPSLANKAGIKPMTALFVPWDITKAIADAVRMPLEKSTLDAGREQCGRILGSR
jgi:ankyrin repeat protein